jgi:ribose transport system ATP-binding protein
MTLPLQFIKINLRKGPSLMANTVLEVKGISKSFSGHKVLEDISFRIHEGEVISIVGENGAGKSTLMKIIGGIYRADSGEIYLEGKKVNFPDPLSAIKSGISIVHQELSLVPNLTVAQNIFSHREPINPFGFIQWSKLYRDTSEIFKQMGLDLDPSLLVEHLSVGMQQLVEIAKALSLNAKLLILDEPTSALSETEVELLYRVVTDLLKKGVAIIFISHKLLEVFRISTNVIVLRDGRLIGAVQPAKGSNYHQLNAPKIDEVVGMMVGRHLTDLYPPKSTGIKEVIFAVEGLKRLPYFENISFELRKGEILGFAGLVGSGRTETARAIFGADPLQAGKVFLEGRELRVKSPRDAIKEGVCYLTEDRKSLGLFLKMTVRNNAVAAAIQKFVSRIQFVKHHRIKEKSGYYVDHLQIRPFDDEVTIVNLSGGNQQKVLFAKWLCASPKVLIVDEPTRGVDVGAKAEIHSQLRKMAEDGVGMIVISSELPEILGLSDRVVIFNEGRITAILDGKTATEEEVMKYATHRKQGMGA